MAQICKLDSNVLDAEVLAGCACAFGVFDGFHVGHQYLVDSMVRRAREDGVRAVVLTFDRDPDEVFRAEGLRKLMSNEERLDVLANSGVDLVVALPFTLEFASLSPEEFLAQTFGAAAPSSLHVGCDFRFGKRAAGTVETLRLWAEQSSVDVVSYELEERAGETVTASRIRGLLAEGKIREANNLLGRRYGVTGRIESGRQQGREMGFATANVRIEANRMTLGAGVYAAYGFVQGVRYKAAVSMGVSPTFEDATAVCEAHLLDFEGDIYGTDLRLEFEEFLRPMKKFDSVEELIREVTANIQWCRDNL